MQLRKFGALISGALLSMSLVACGGSATDTATQTDTQADTAATTETTEVTKYRIATDSDFPPFEFADTDGTYVGIDVDILAAVAADQGFEYELSPLGFDAALEAVQSGQADGVIAGMSIRPDREKVFDFSEPYFDSTVCCAVADTSDAKSLEDLKGKNVAVKKGTLSQEWAESIAGEYGFQMTIFDDSPTMVQDVMAGNSVACFEDTPVMAYNISTGKVALKIIDEVDATSSYASQYGFAVNKGANAELLKKFNDGLANIKANGTFDQIVAKYTSQGAAGTSDAKADAATDAKTTDAKADAATATEADAAEQTTEQAAA